MTDDVGNTLADIVEALTASGIAYMVVGSIAAMAHGRKRATQDFDIVVNVDGDQAIALVRSLDPERFYATEEAARDAVRDQTLFNVIDMVTGWKVDLVPKKRREFSDVEFARRHSVEMFGHAIFVASLEDTIISKLEWSKLGGGSQRQLEDVRELLQSPVGIDRGYVEDWVSRLGLQAQWKAAHEG